MERSTLDLLHTLKALETWRVSIIAVNSLNFDLSIPYGRMIATIIAGIAEFERELIKERIPIKRGALSQLNSPDFAALQFLDLA